MIQPICSVAELLVHGGSVQFPDADQFLAHVKDRQRVVFRELKNPRDDKVTLDLTKSMSYDDVCVSLANALAPAVTDPSTLRLTMHNAYSNAPKGPPLGFRGVETLCDALAFTTRVESKKKSDVLYCTCGEAFPNPAVHVLPLTLVTVQTDYGDCSDRLP